MHLLMPHLKTCHQSGAPARAALAMLRPRDAGLRSHLAAERMQTQPLPSHIPIDANRRKQTYAPPVAHHSSPENHHLGGVLYE